MKKPQFTVILIITLLFIAFTVGFFVGRNLHNGEIQISAVMSTTPMETRPPLPTETVPEETIVFPIDLNTATREELMALPGIGEITADKILAYRDAYGPFYTVYDLLNVPDIGQKTLEEILDFICVGG